MCIQFILDTWYSLPIKHQQVSVSCQILKELMTNVKTRTQCNCPVQTGGQAGKRNSIREQKLRLVKTKSDAGDSASPHVVAGWICISADKTFSSETAFTEPFRYTSSMKKWVWPSLFCVNLPSFTQDTIGFISPPNTPIHMPRGSVHLTNETKLLLIVF